MSLSATLSRWAHQVWQTRNPLSVFLYPLSLVTRYVVQRKRARFSTSSNLAYRSPCPVIVVGNIVVGGTGKTPVVVAITRHLQSKGWAPGLISRGYGVHISDHVPRLARGHADAQQIGDEPALLTQATGAPICVHPQRALAAQALLEQYPDVNVIIADDGMQHLALARDIEIAVQDHRGVGNGWLLPAGPLRDQASALSKVDWLITHINPNDQQPDTPHPQQTDRNLRMYLRPYQVHSLHGEQQFDWLEWQAFCQGKSISAVAAIGQPQRFFTMLRQAGLTLTHTRALADHAAIDHSSFVGLHSDYILITRKDAVKYKAGRDPRIYVVEAQAMFSHPNWLDDLAHSTQQHHNALTQRAP